jgi:hypothetical protein
VSKPSRRRQPPGSTAGSRSPAPGISRSGGTSPAHSTSPTGTPRAGRRERARVAYQPSFVERYRTAIIGVAVLASAVLIASFVFLSASASAYACSVEWTPSPTASPAAGASPDPGYVQPDMGRTHVPLGQKVTYTYCPPASGFHYNSAGSGPIQPRLYGPNDHVLPEGWMHNLEHGALVLLYRGHDGDPGPTDAGQTSLRAFFDAFPPSPICGIQPGTSTGPVIARFDDMATPYAALVWGRVLPLQELDTAQILEFWQIWGERTNPEKQCQVTSPAPSVETSPAPSTESSPAPSSEASPATSPSDAAPSPS